MSKNKSHLYEQAQDCDTPILFVIFEKIIPVFNYEKLNASLFDALFPNVSKSTKIFLFKELSELLHLVSLVEHYLKT